TGGAFPDSDEHRSSSQAEKRGDAAAGGISEQRKDELAGPSAVAEHTGADWGGKEWAEPACETRVIAPVPQRQVMVAGSLSHVMPCRSPPGAAVVLSGYGSGGNRYLIIVVGVDVSHGCVCGADTTAGRRPTPGDVQRNSVEQRLLP
ncbi:hypothetical protein NET03_12915, partial [Thermomicrobium sp. CFH 73360]|uniref:hypothetical protein n=1 Tax=Thermomicrobium sp. CFH 73360 TaxID=2951987 RepID=UPI002076E358